jgi:hypothetical protein
MYQYLQALFNDVIFYFGKWHIFTVLSVYPNVVVLVGFRLALDPPDVGSNT